MAKIYLTPGPSQLFYSFKDHLNSSLNADVGSISHRSQQFIDIVERTTSALRTLLEIPDAYHVFFISSANEAWDRIIQNLVIHSSHHFVNGSFSKKFYDFALLYSMKSTATIAADGGPFPDFNVPEDAELIGITKNETSVGYSFTNGEIRDLRTKYPDKLIALDIVSAAPTQPIEFEHIDTAYFSVQKCFGMPPGLGVWIVNNRCLEKAKEKLQTTPIGCYRAIPNLIKFADKGQTAETPNALYIDVLGKIAEDMLNLGINRIRNEAKYKSALVDGLVGRHHSIDHFVTSKVHQSITTKVLKTSQGVTLRSKMAEKGYVIGSGYSQYKESHIRIANFPTHSKESFEFLIDELDKIL